MNIKEYVITSVEDFKALSTTWKSLESGQDMTAFQSFDWNLFLAEEFFSSLYNRLFASIKVYIVSKQDAPVMILPVIMQKASIKILWWGRKKGCYLLGEGSFSDYMNVIYKDFDASALQMLVEKVPHPLLFNNIRSTTAAADSFNALSSTSHSTPSVYVELEPSVDAYMTTLSKSVKQNLRTAVNRMNKAGLTYEIKVLDGTLDEALAKKLIGMHDVRASSKNKKHDRNGLHWVSRFIRNKYRAYQNKHYNIIFQSMTRNASGVTIIACLENEPAGYLYGLIDHNAIRIMHNCFKEDYKFYSPMFRGAFDFICSEISDQKHNLQQVDFTRGDEGYKFQLGGKELPLEHYMIL